MLHFQINNLYLSFLLVNSTSLESLQNIKQTLHKKMFDEAVTKQNIGLASIYQEILKKSESQIEMSALIDLLSTNSNAFHLVENKLSLINYNIMLSKQQSNNHYFDALKNEFNIVIQLWKMLRATPIHSDICYNILNLKCEISKQIFKYIQEYPISPINEFNLKNMLQESKLDNIIDIYYEECINSMQSLSSMALNMSNENNSKEERNLIGSSFYNLAHFCYAYINNSQLIQPDDIDKTIIYSILQAMAFESKEARRLFPCVLELPSIKNGNNLDQETFFKQNLPAIPEWMFITWIPQILSYMNTSRPNHLDDIISRIAFSYPTALKHTFELWYENLKDEKRHMVKEIKTRLNSPITDKFVECFKYLCIPEMLLKTHLKTFYKTVISDSNINQEEFIQKLNKLISTVYTKNDSLQVRNISLIKNKYIKLSVIKIEPNKY